MMVKQWGVVPISSVSGIQLKTPVGKGKPETVNVAPGIPPSHVNITLSLSTSKVLIKNVIGSPAQTPVSRSNTPVSPLIPMGKGRLLLQSITLTWISRIIYPICTPFLHSLMSIVITVTSPRESGVMQKSPVSESKVIGGTEVRGCEAEYGK